MSAFIDFEEKSVDKAVEKACKALNVSKDRLQYDIISYGSSGIFGIVGAKKALIRVTPPPEASEKEKPSRPGKTQKPAEKKQRKSSAKSRRPEKEQPAPPQGSPVGEEADISALVDEAFGESPSFPDEEDAAAQAAPVVADEEPEVPMPETAYETVQETMPDEEKEEGSPEGGEEGWPRKAPPGPGEYEAAAAWVREFLEQAVRLISPDSEIRMEDNNGILRFKIAGGDAARMIGKRGQTLDTIQYLAEKAVGKQFGHGIPVEIDVDEYLDKRRTELKQLANRLAQKAAQTGKPMVINRINVNDRRIVHLELKENSEIRTQSTGNGDLRKLLILPKKKAPGKKPAARGRKPGNGRRRPDNRHRKPEDSGQNAETEEQEQGIDNNDV